MTRKAITKKTKDAIQKRSKGICEVCRFAPARDIHHIIPVAEGGTNKIGNLSYLCGYCHKHVPGDYPDGYVDEFEIYKANGGHSWATMAHGFWLGWMAHSNYKSIDYKRAMKEFAKVKEGTLNHIKNTHMPIRISTCYEVFK